MGIYTFSAPTIVMRHLGREVSDVYLVFAPIAVGLVCGCVCFPGLERELRAGVILGLAYGLLGLSVALNLAVSTLLSLGLVQLLPLFFYSFGLALALPILIDRALGAVHEHAGIAASCQTFLQFAIVAAGAGLLSLGSLIFPQPPITATQMNAISI